MWLKTRVYFAVVVALFLINRTASAGCETIPFKHVVPIEKSWMEKRLDKPVCLFRSNKSVCSIEAGFSAIVSTNLHQRQKVYLLTEQPPSDGQMVYWNYLQNSRVIRSINEFRMQARRVAGLNVCEPNYIYLENKKIFGVGPAFASSTHFDVDGKYTANFLVMDEGKLGGLPITALSKEGLYHNHYLDIVTAHEIAHGLMQDLYGVDGFAELENRVITRDGHFASAITDPRLAWIEGFAEAFEAYLGEKHMSIRQLATPHFDKVVRDGRRAVDKSFVERMLFGISSAFSNLQQMSNLLTDFLKNERQRPIRNNLFVLRGQFSNLSHTYGVSIGLVADDEDDLFGGRPEFTEALWSKEGFVAHVIYTILDEGLAEQMFQTIARNRPQNLAEFLNAFLPDINFETHQNLERTLLASLTADGRLWAREPILKVFKSKDAGTGSYQEILSTLPLGKLTLPGQFQPPTEAWIEFRNIKVMHELMSGSMDRLNLPTASATRLKDFVDSLDWFTFFNQGRADHIQRWDEVKSFTLKALVTARDVTLFRGLTPTFQEIRNSLSLRIKRAAQNDRLLIDAQDFALIGLQNSRECFLEKCLSH